MVLWRGWVPLMVMSYGYGMPKPRVWLESTLLTTAPSAFRDGYSVLSIAIGCKKLSLTHSGWGGPEGREVTRQT